MISFRPTARFDKQSTIICLTREQIQKKIYSFEHANVKESINGLVKSKQFTGKDGEVFPILQNNKLVVLIGIGKEKDFSLTAFRITLRNALLSRYLKNSADIEIILADQKDPVVIAAIEAVIIGTYVWDKYKSDSKKEKIKKQYLIVGLKKKIYDEAIAICHGTNLTRDLINENADTATSVYLEKVIKDLVKGKKNVSLEILNAKEMKAKGLGLHLAVNQGSVNEPKLIIVKYTGAVKSEKYTAFIGKGMTFDTGGLNLKPSNHIETMRIDMSGAGAVIGTLKNVLDLELKKNIIFAVGLAENVTGSRSYKPGDVITGYAGKSVEIANTDAEGRLVLADAISYIVKNYKPSRIFDIATLTGACVVALGHDYTGLVTTDDRLSREVVHSSNITDDRVWRLPMYPELKDSVKSKIADIRNLGFPRGAGGTITAAEFLRQFTEDTPWVHLDIAGTAFVDNSSRMYFGHGATGAGVRLMTNFFQNH